MNERQIIEYITSVTGQADGQLLMGIGDDCAVIRKENNRVWLLTMDTLIEAVHFDISFHPPRKLGRKAVSVNVSDIGAMGGKPVFALLSTGLPPGFDDAWFQEFISGLTDACREYGCCVIGGDTVASPGGFTFTLTIIGEADEDKVIYRSGGQPGDTIWVSGELGFAAAGLELLRARKGEGNPEYDAFREKHLNPQARVTLGRQLAASGLVNAMMDISDGLATDLAHLCKQSGLGARLTARNIPGVERLAGAASLIGRDPLAWSISGGEDYELLFTAEQECGATLTKIAAINNVAIFPVGTLVPGEGVTLIQDVGNGVCKEVAVSYQGFDHFRASASA